MLPVWLRSQGKTRSESTLSHNFSLTTLLSSEMCESQPRSIRNSSTASDHQGRQLERHHSNPGTAEVPRLDQPNKDLDLALHRDKKDTHRYLRSQDTHEKKIISEPGHLYQPTVEDVSHGPPELLRAIGERPIASYSIRHPAGYTLRPLPGRRAVSLATWQSRFSPPKTAHERAQEAEERARHKANRKKANAQIRKAQLRFSPDISGLPNKTTLVQTRMESVQPQDHVSDNSAPNPAYQPHSVLSLRPRVRVQREAMAVFEDLGFEQRTPQIVMQAQELSSSRRLTQSQLEEDAREYSKSDDSHVQSKRNGDGTAMQVSNTLDPSHRSTMLDEALGPIAMDKTVTENIMNRKRKASEELQDSDRNRTLYKKRKRHHKRRKAAATAINAFFETTDKIENDKSCDTKSTGIMLQKHIDDVQRCWPSLDEQDKQRLLTAGFRPSKAALAISAALERQKLRGDQIPSAIHEPSPNVQTDSRTLKAEFVESKDVEGVVSQFPIQSAKNVDEKLLTEHKGRSHGPKGKGAQRLSEGELEKKKLEQEAGLASEVRAKLEAYQQQRRQRAGMENLLEQSFAETGEAYIKVEGKDGKPEYVVWKDLLEMELEEKVKE